MNIVKLNPKEYGLEDKQVETIEQAFLPKIVERDGLSKIYEQILTKELTPKLCNEAKQVRLKLVKVRTGIAEIHKTQKAFFLAAGRFVDAWKNKETAPVEQMEENLEKIENHFVNIEKQRIADLEAKRTEQLRQYTEIIPMSLGLMQEDVFQAYYASQKKAYEDRIAAERQAELDRIAKEKAEAEERERIRIENERLKKEAEERENAIEAERKEQAAILAKQQVEAAAKQKAIEDAARIEREKAADERAKLEAELSAKLEAEAKVKAEADRIERERIKAAKAPRKQKLQTWVQSMNIVAPSGLESDSVAIDIVTKFESFKKWAVNQIENI